MARVVVSVPSGPGPQHPGRAEHQADHRRQHPAVVPLEQAVQQGREQREADHAAHAEHEQREEVAVVHRAEDLGVHPEHHEDERAGDAGQDHGADRHRAGEEEHPPRLASPPRRRRRRRRCRIAGRAAGTSWRRCRASRASEMPSTRSSIRRATQIDPMISPRNSAAMRTGCSSSSRLEDRRQREDRREDAGEEGDQPDPLDALERLGEPGDVAGEQLLEAVCALADVADQPVVDAEDEGDGSARHAGHDVGRAHGEAAGDLARRGRNLHAANLPTSGTR